MESSYTIMADLFVSRGTTDIRGEKMAANEARALQRPKAFPFKILG